MTFFLAAIVAFLAVDLARRAPALRGRAIGAMVIAILIALWMRPPGAVLQKSIGRMVMPVGLCWTGMLIATLWTLPRRQRLGLWLLGGFLLLTLMGNDWIAASMFRWIEAPIAQRRPLQIQRPLDAVVVLGGGIGPSPAGEAQCGQSGDRAILAARLFHRGKTPRLIAVGAPVPGYSMQDDAAALTAAIWRDLRIPPQAIIVHRAGAWNTKREIEAASALCRDRGWTRVGLLTSAWHLRRALRHCDRHGWQVVPLAADWRGDPRYDGLLTIIPSGPALASIHHICWELVGAAVGR